MIKVSIESNMDSIFFWEKFLAVEDLELSD